MKTRILYVSGLGDGYDGFRAACLKLWQLFGVETQLVASKWYNGENYSTKINNLSSQIDQAYAANRRVVIVGESAGATLSLIAGQDKKVSRVITLCGVTNPRASIGAGIRHRSPAFIFAVNNLTNVKLDGVTSVRALVDITVRRKDSIWPGSRVRVVFWIGHLPTIVLCLTALAPWMVRLATREKL